jgi:ubiquinone biosynthesis protein
MIRIPSHLWRLLRTGATFERTGAMRDILDALEVRGWPRLAIRSFAWPFGMFGRAGNPDLPPLPRALQAMGPAYVKFGQVLSTRPDVTGKELGDQLRYLQDRLTPFPTDEARQAIAGSLGARAWELIGDLGEPVAAASIAQVHPAIWKPTGAKVAIKVLRPGVRRQFRADIGAFYFIAGLIERIVPGARRLRPTAVVAHFEGVVTIELDLRLEAAAANEYRDNARNDNKLLVPEVYWAGTGSRVLTLEWAEGLPPEPEPLAAAGLDLPEIATRLIQTFLRQALHDGYFHADMHQGNIRVAPDGTLIMLDFGIMGRLDPITRRHYAEILFGFINREYRRCAEVHFEAGYVPADRDVEAFAQSLRAIAEPIHGQDGSAISMARLLGYLLETAERFGMETRTELILLQRTMVVVEGVARSIDPHSNIWESAKPVVEDWIRENLGPAQIARDIASTAKILTRLGPRLPDLAKELVMLAEEARIRRSQGVEPVETGREGRWQWLLCGAAIGLALAAALLQVL